MTVLLYLFIPVLIVAVVATAMWYRNRQPTSLEAGVQAFRREMDALSPDAHLHQQEGAETRRTRQTDQPEQPQSPTDGSD